MNWQFSWQRSKWLAPLCMFCAALLVAAGCGEPRTKTINELYDQERSLPALYITAESATPVIAPGGQPAFIHLETGEIAYPALECQNPDCPGRTASGPFLFAAPDPTLIIVNGKLDRDTSGNYEVDNLHGNCPKCLTIRAPQLESDADRKRYADFVKPHVLPETERRRKELAEQRKKRQAELERRMQRKVED